jgi:hypothetical protein
MKIKNRATSLRCSSAGLLCAAILLLTLFFSCAKNSSTGIQTPPETTHEVNSANPVFVTDTIAGVTLLLPKGGRGNVTITVPALQPGMDTSDHPFTIRSTGVDSIEIALPCDSANERGYVCGFVSTKDACLDDSTDTTKGFWALMPSAGSSADTAYYAVATVSSGGLAKTAAWYGGVPVYKAYTIPKSKTYDTLYATFEKMIGTAITSLIDSLPPVMQASATAAVGGPLKHKLYLAVNSRAWLLKMSNCKYVPFYDIFNIGFFPACQIQLYEAADAGNIAHETGHYFHHVLIGNSAYAKFARNHRPSGHCVGSQGAKYQIIEDPAYCAEYMLNGSVKSGNPTGGNFIASANGGKGPSEIDYTDCEGFPTVMLSQLARKDTQVMNYKARIQGTPLITGLGFRKIFSIIGSGVDNAMKVRDSIEAALAATGQRDKMSAIMAPLGWLYKVKCTLVDTAHTPIKGVYLRPVCKTAAREYCLDKSALATDAAGAVTIDEVYAGAPTLRVYLADGDSADIDSVRIGWNSPTNSLVDIGELKLSVAALNLRSATPDTAVTGSSITLLGSGFGSLNDSCAVLFGKTAVKSFAVWSATRIVVNVPQVADTSDVKMLLTVQIKGKKSNAILFTALQNLYSIDTAITRCFACFEAPMKWNTALAGAVTNPRDLMGAWTRLIWKGTSFTGFAAVVNDVSNNVDSVSGEIDTAGRMITHLKWSGNYTHKTSDTLSYNWVYGFEAKNIRLYQRVMPTLVEFKQSGLGILDSNFIVAPHAIQTKITPSGSSIKSQYLGVDKTINNYVDIRIDFDATSQLPQ